MSRFATITAAAAVCALTRSTGVSAEGAQGSRWGYRLNDPSMVECGRWADEWETCGGDRQSPININTTRAVRLRGTFPLTFSGKCPSYSLSQPNEPLEADVLNGTCTVVLRNTEYDMAQFHLHAPSEHTLNGRRLNGEIHFVHKATNSDALLVVGIFLRLNPTSDPWLSPLLDALENVKSADQSEAVTVQLDSYAELVEEAYERRGAFNYLGSLTTPGCAETVNWWVLRHPMNISSVDFGRLHQDLLEYDITDDGNNARPIQHMRGRVVKYYRPARP